ncbi:unnamed protein product [Ceratitis capitata]|uniref:(Mediterranean fruit fly) hypothetical protein n=1 Tax=Ceratitis capitata TaxID=7213 RepID=A0A811UQA9_CERCA|nr:unnamed protein product [Ceratitis capitata]
MERTPPRRSARLMKTGSISSSIVAISTNSTMPMVSTSGSITTTATTRLDDGAPSIISVRNVVAADTAQVSRQSTEDKPTSHNIDDIEKRLAVLEATLKATQVQSTSSVKSVVTLESSNPIMSPDNSHQPLRSNNARV